jgi:phosphotransferase system  glucose/maltose/N-acetylglucosamine-specific IIC component
MYKLPILGGKFMNKRLVIIIVVVVVLVLAVLAVTSVPALYQMMLRSHGLR